MPQQPIRKPFGEPIELTDDELDQESIITQADLKRAAALWQSEAPKPLRDLLQAEIEEDQ